MVITTILPKINRNIFTSYFYSSQKKKRVPTKPTIAASPTSQKTITASLLSRWATIHQQRLWKTLSSIHGQKIQESNTGHISVNGKSSVKIAILFQKKNRRRLRIPTYALKKRIKLLRHQHRKENAIHDTTSM